MLDHQTPKTDHKRNSGVGMFHFVLLNIPRELLSYKQAYWSQVTVVEQVYQKGVGTELV